MVLGFLKCNKNIVILKKFYFFNLFDICAKSKNRNFAEY